MGFLSGKLPSLKAVFLVWFVPVVFGARIKPKVQPAMEAGISDHVWSLEEIVGLLP